jgi:hypothetical protein
MDIKKIVRKVLLEQEVDENPQPQLTRAQREALASLTQKWRQEVPSLTDGQATEIYLKYRELLPSIKNEKQQAIRAFILRGDGKYTINDLRDISRVTLKDLLTFLLEFNKYRILLGPDVSDQDVDKLKLDRIFNQRTDRGTGGITPEKIEVSKQMWEGSENLVYNDGNGFRVYWIPNREFSVRMGYYYQEKLREYLQYNIDNGKTPTSANPWCIVGRSSAQTVYYKNIEMVRGVSNQYPLYRRESSYYYIIDETKDLFGANGDYYIGALLAGKKGDFQLAPITNGQYYLSQEKLFTIYPQLKGQLEKLTYHDYDEATELNDGEPISILDRMNEVEGSPFAFWMQGPEEKSQYINDDRTISNPKSWETLTDELRNEYLNRITKTNATSRISSYEFMNAIVKSGNAWKNTLNYKLTQLGLPGVSYLAENFMQREFAPDFIGKKNPNIKIYKSKVSKTYGIYDLNNLKWIEKDGITYEPEFKKNILKAPEGDLFDDENNKEYIVTEFQSSNAKFYTLSDFEDIGRNFNVFILSEKKYKELRDKVESQGMDDTNDVNIAEEQY